MRCAVDALSEHTSGDSVECHSAVCADLGAIERQYIRDAGRAINSIYRSCIVLLSIVREPSCLVYANEVVAANASQFASGTEHGTSAWNVWHAVLDA